MSTQLGIAAVMAAGIVMGGSAWPIKVMKHLQFEHWWFVGMLTGLVVIPWTVTLSLCPHAIQAYSTVPVHTIILSNLFSLGWGVANLLCALCFVRIGMALTGAVLTGLGVSLGVTMPMLFKGSGLFSNAAGIASPAGKMVLLGVAAMLTGVVAASFAGFGRDRMQSKTQKCQGGFLAGLLMAMAAGLLSAGISFAFVYSQGPIMDAMKHNGASEVAATFAVWAVGLSGGALINILYPVVLMTKKRNWGVLLQNGREAALASIIGINFCAGTALLGKGMLMLGALGASVGFGIQQAMQMLGGQGVGFISGEWSGVHGTPRRQMYSAIALLVLAAIVMAYGNTLAK